MDPHDAWKKALRSTEIVRPRVRPLATHEATRLPYVFLAEEGASSTWVRKGEVWVERPSIVLPEGLPQFEGFDFERATGVEEEFLRTFFLVRGVRFPSVKYRNEAAARSRYDGRLSAALEHFRQELGRAEDVHTGLIRGRDDCWPFAVLLFVCQQVARSAESDLRRLLEDFPGPSGPSLS